MNKKITESIAVEKIIEKCNSLNYKFNGFEQNIWNGYYTKLKLSCNVHNHIWNTTSYANFIRGRSKGCAKCRLEKSNKSRGFDREKYEYNIANRLKDKKHIVFIGWKDGCKNSQSYMILKCKKHNLTWDTTTYTNFIRRNKSLLCECCVNEKIANERKMDIRDAIDKAVNALSGSGDKYKVIGFDGGYINNSTKNLIIECSYHGRYKTKLGNHINGRGCPRCANRGYQPLNQGTIYIQKLNYNSSLVGVKFGITNGKAQERMRNQSRVSKFDHEIFYELTLQDGQKILDLENKIKEAMKGKTSYISKEDMPDGWTETVAPSELSTIMYIVKSFEKELTA